MKGFFAALGFLTIIPAGVNAGDSESLRKSFRWFPAVGLLIGVGLASAYYALNLALPPAPVAALIVVLMSAVSGGLHIDGLADTADGLLSGAPRERVIEIMKDSRSGAMAIFAVASVLIVKTTAITSLTAEWATTAILLAPLAGRIAIYNAMLCVPYVSGSGGLGHAFGAGGRRDKVASATILLAAGFIGAGISGILWAVSLYALWAIFSAWLVKRIGGMTGDNYGALCEITETASLLFFAGVCR
ncbi:MAG: adenosylcobinamide-GDP ribazoletransferase [Nitrospinae bacterium]|nr:adenosylcobinamide-GDP ribazoletransferase [Nitrospinota bacterium]